MSINQFIFLKMGKKILFKENLLTLKNSDIRAPQSCPPGIKIRKLELDIIPKFIANENMQELNNELMDRLLKKKNIFNKMMNSYFSQNEVSFTNSIQEVENEMNRCKDIMENNKNKDFEGFMNLLSFINGNKTNMKLTAMQNITLNDYKNMNYDTRKIIYGGIYENRPFISQKLNLKYGIDINKIEHDDKKVIPIKPKPNPNPKPVRPSIKKKLVSQEQINLFKISVGNPRITDEHVISYFDVSNPNVIMAVNNYFKNIYGVDCLTLHYYYPSKGPNGVRTHRFRFTAEIKDLFMSAQDDYISVMNPRLYLENGKEIINDKKKYKCIGALNLSNNSKIKVLG